MTLRNGRAAMADKQKMGAEAKGKSVATAPAKGDKPAMKENAGKAGVSAKDVAAKGKGKGG